jgi:high-affinity iron transporter
VVEEVFPPRPPSAARGRALFAENCVSCHGENADGRGANAADLKPPPADFSSAEFMRAETPFDFYHIISVGKPTSAMPAWGQVLSLQDRWDLVSFLWTVEPGSRRLAEGQGVFLAECAGCHGATGDGKGALSEHLLTPAPALNTAEALARRSDEDLLRALQEGVPGTAMPRFAQRLNEGEMRAAVSFLRFLSLGGERAAVSPADGSEGSGRRFAGLLRLLAEEYARARPSGAAPNDLEYAESLLLLEQIRLRSAAVLAGVEAHHAGDAGRVEGQLAELARSIEAKAPSASVVELATAAAAAIERHSPAEVPAPAEDDPLGETARLLRSALDAYGRGDAQAVYLVSDAYFQFEPVEKELAVAAPDVTRRVESAFLELRGVLSRPGDSARAAEIVAAIESDVAAARAALQPNGSPGALAVQSATIILREGFEVVLIIGALLAYVVKSGNPGMRRPILLGTAAGVVSSLISAFVLVQLFRASGAAAEVVEGVAMLLATVVLFSVSYWLISKAEAEKWQRYIQGKVKVALARGSALALAGAAFLAVYREGVETVLFYQALLASAAGDVQPVAAGFVAGAVLLAVLYFGFMRLGMRIPLRPFFLGTSVLLYYLAFVFAGKGVRELQEAALVGVTPVPFVPGIDLLGIYPTAETLLIQAILLACLVYAITVTLRGQGRRRLRGEIAELRAAAVEIRDELARTRAAGGILGAAASQRLESFIDRVGELESQMSLRFSGNGGTKT